MNHTLCFVFLGGILVNALANFQTRCVCEAGSVVVSAKSILEKNIPYPLSHVSTVVRISISKWIS